jgi:hypothetical protein
MKLRETIKKILLEIAPKKIGTNIYVSIVDEVIDDSYTLYRIEDTKKHQKMYLTTIQIEMLNKFMETTKK